MLRKLTLTTLFFLFASPAMAGDLFPPETSTYNSTTSQYQCPSGMLLKWTGNSVECSKELTTDGSCSPGQTVSGVVDGVVQCSGSLAIAGCNNPTIGGAVYALRPAVQFTLSTDDAHGRIEGRTTVTLLNDKLMGYAINCNGSSGTSAAGNVISPTSRTSARAPCTCGGGGNSFFP